MFAPSPVGEGRGEGTRQREPFPPVGEGRGEGTRQREPFPLTLTLSPARRGDWLARAFPLTAHAKKGSIFNPDFSIILRPHVTRRFFSRNFLVSA